MASVWVAVSRVESTRRNMPDDLTLGSVELLGLRFVIFSRDLKRTWMEGKTATRDSECGSQQIELKWLQSRR